MKDSENSLLSKLLSTIGDVLNNPDNDNHIDLNEEDATEFFYVLGAMLPTVIYSELTNNKTNVLDFNHLVNSLIVQKGFKLELID